MSLGPCFLMESVQCPPPVFDCTGNQCRDACPRPDDSWLYVRVRSTIVCADTASVIIIV